MSCSPNPGSVAAVRRPYPLDIPRQLRRSRFKQVVDPSDGRSVSAMGVIRSFKIELNPSGHQNGVYYTGEVITGWVLVDLKEEMKVRGRLMSDATRTQPSLFHGCITPVTAKT